MEYDRAGRYSAGRRVRRGGFGVPVSCASGAFQAYAFYPAGGACGAWNPGGRKSKRCGVCAKMLPEDETPETTEGYQGFYHLLGIQSNIELAKLNYIIRDHDREKFEDRKHFIMQCAEKMNEKYGEGTVEAVVSDQYYNMKEKIDPQMHVIDLVLRAMQDTGVAPKVSPIRGGTDGAQLSFKGLPCPNIFAGGVNFHGPYEFVSIQSMEKAMNVIVKICELTAGYND